MVFFASLKRHVGADRADHVLLDVLGIGPVVLGEYIDRVSRRFDDVVGAIVYGVERYGNLRKERRSTVILLTPSEEIVDHCSIHPFFVAIHSWDTVVPATFVFGEIEGGALIQRPLVEYYRSELIVTYLGA